MGLPFLLSEFKSRLEKFGTLRLASVSCGYYVENISMTTETILPKL